MTVSTANYLYNQGTCFERGWKALVNYPQGKGPLYWTLERVGSYAIRALEIIGGLSALGCLLSFAFPVALPFFFVSFAICMALHQLMKPRAYSIQLRNGSDCLSRQIEGQRPLLDVAYLYGWDRAIDYYASKRDADTFCKRIRTELRQMDNRPAKINDVIEELRAAKAPAPFFEFLD